VEGASIARSPRRLTFLALEKRQFARWFLCVAPRSYLRIGSAAPADADLPAPSIPTESYDHSCLSVEDCFSCMDRDWTRKP
jgi:hypothetical protein